LLGKKKFLFAIEDIEPPAKQESPEGPKQREGAALAA